MALVLGKRAQRNAGWRGGPGRVDHMSVLLESLTHPRGTLLKMQILGPRAGPGNLPASPLQGILMLVVHGAHFEKPCVMTKGAGAGVLGACV